MSVQFQEKSYLGQKNILATPDGYVCVEVELEQNSELAVEEGGRKIIKAGTFYPANDESCKGVIFNDYDVTDGDRVGALLIAGNVLVPALPSAPNQAAVKALPRVSFIKKGEIFLGAAAPEVEDITAISGEILSQLKPGDVVIKVTGEQKHSYRVSYKQEGHGICLTYVDASTAETVSYDFTDGEWVYNSTDKGDIPPHQD